MEQRARLAEVSMWNQDGGGECPKGQSPFDKAISPSLLDQQKERRGQGMRDFHIYFIADAPAGRI